MIMLEPRATKDLVGVPEQKVLAHSHVVKLSPQQSAVEDELEPHALSL